MMNSRLKLPEEAVQVWACPPVRKWTIPDGTHTPSPTADFYVDRMIWMYNERNGYHDRWIALDRYNDEAWHGTRYQTCDTNPLWAMIHGSGELDETLNRPTRKTMKHNWAPRDAHRPHWTAAAWLFYIITLISVGWGINELWNDNECPKLSVTQPWPRLFGLKCPVKPITNAPWPA